MTFQRNQIVKREHKPIILRRGWISQPFARTSETISGFCTTICWIVISVCKIISTCQDATYRRLLRSENYSEFSVYLILKSTINRHFRPPVGAVCNRTGLACFIIVYADTIIPAPNLPVLSPWCRSEKNRCALQ